MDAPRANLTVIVLTFNEEENLPSCLESVLGWAREIFVVDSYSTDRTVDVALAYADRGVRVVQHTFEGYAKQWNWALTKLPVTARWALKLDADERVTQDFREEVTGLLARADDRLEGVYFRRRFYFMRKPLKWSGELGYDLRLWRSGTARFEDRSLNEHVLVTGGVAYVKSYVDHIDHKPIADWLEKHNRYSSLEAENILKGDISGDVAPRFWGTPDERRMWLRGLYRAIPFRATLYFVYLYIFRAAILDGVGGFRYSLLRSHYRYWIELKIREHRELGTNARVVWPARGEPHSAVALSELQRLVDVA